MSALWRCSPAGMRCLSEISVKSPLRETYRRDLSETSQKRCLFCQVFKTFQIHLKKDVFCVTSWRRLGHISKKVSFPWRLWDASKTSLASIFGFPKTRHKNTSQKHVTKMISCDFRRLIKISDKINVGLSETLKKWNVLWDQCIDINQVCPVGWYLPESFDKSRIFKTY